MQLRPDLLSAMENFGLITLDEYQTEYKGESAYETLYHEIIHQWIGNIVTISDWREICLQEGLTSYFGWKLMEDFRNQSLQDKLARTIEYRRGLEYDDSDNAGHSVSPYSCYDRAAAFLHIMASWDGFDALERFVELLIKKKAYGTANLELWDTTMDEIVKREEDGMKSFVKSKNPPLKQ